MERKLFELKFFEGGGVPRKKNFKIFQNGNGTKLYGTAEGKLYYFQFENNQWTTKLIDDPQNTIDDTAKLLYVTSINNNQDILIMRASKGLFIYSYEDRNLTSLCKFNNFRYLNGWNKVENEIQFGNLFESSDVALLGMMTTHVKEGVNFYKMNLEKLLMCESFMQRIDTNNEILDQFSPNRSKIFLASLRNQQKEMIISRNADGLNIFQFNATTNSIERIMNINHASYQSQTSVTDRFFFPSLNYKNDWNDIALFNSSGLFQYQYIDNPMPNYEFSHYDPIFSEALGWTEQHAQTIRFEDIDGDGCDEMIFTGPAGIDILSYNYDAQGWHSLIDVSKISPQQRHSSVMYIVPQDNEIFPNPVIFSHYSGNFDWSQLIEIPSKPENLIESDEEYFPAMRINSIIPSINIQLSNKKKSILYLRDNIDCSTLLDAVNPDIGRPKFLLPLIGDSSAIVKLHLHYDGSKSANTDTTPGNGWSIQNNYIFLDFQESIFEEDEIFYWVSNDIPYKLKLTAITSESRAYSIDMISSEKQQMIKCEIKFYHSINNWQIIFETKDGTRKLFYGKHGRYGTIAYDLTWKNWRGIGSDRNEQTKCPYIWYLSILEEEDGTFSNFEYETVMEFDNNQAYTREVYLKTISDNRNHIKLFYENKNPNEYNLRQRDEEGNYNRNLIQTRYLAGYTFETLSTEQNIIFKYILIDGSRLLTEIVQLSDYIEKPIFEFKYEKLCNKNYIMKEMILPSRTEISFDYMLQDLKAGQIIENGHIKVLNDYKVSYGIDFVLVSYIDATRKQLVLRLFNREMTQELYATEMISSRSKFSWPLLGDPSDIIESYEIIASDIFIVVILHYSGKISHQMAGRYTDGLWEETFSTYNYSTKSTVLNGQTYIIISDHESKLILFEWEQSEGRWKEWKDFNITITSSMSLSLYRNNFAVYNDEDIFLGYKNTIDKKWILNVLANEPNFIGITKETLMKFDLESYRRDFYLNAFISNALQMSQNLIILNSLAFDSEKQQFLSKIKAFIIGRDHSIAKTTNIEIPQDFLSEMTLKESNKNNIITLKYDYVDDKFKIRLKSIKGPNERNKEILASEIENLFNSPAKRFFLHTQNYFIALNGQNLFCSNIKYTFNGVEWRKTENPKDNGTAFIPLGDKLIIRKSNYQSNVELISRNSQTLLFDFNVRNLNEIQFNYPIYIASQPHGKSITVAEIFDDKELKINRKTLPNGENLSPFGNAQWLVTFKQSISTEEKILIFRSLYGVERFSPNCVITKKKIKIAGISGGSMERVTGYSYEPSSAAVFGNIIIYNNVQINPGNNVTLYGYIKLLSSSRSFYNRNGQLVKQLQQEQDELNEEIETPDEIAFRRNTTLYDRTNHLEIASMNPYSLTSQMVGYIGFEDYESNRIGENQGWSFNQSKIEKKGFSLTGKNYLHLDNDIIEGVFIPEIQDEVLLASCWIRTGVDHLLNIGSTIPFLRASVHTIDGASFAPSWLSVVKRKIDNWSYLEVAVDLIFAHHLFEARNGKKADRLKITIDIGPTTKIPIDVDNVRFSPLSNIFDINVYDLVLNEKIAIIKKSGAIERYLFDKNGMQIAEINELNQIEEFKTYTKDSYFIESHRFQNPKCIIELRSQKGFYEDFSPIAFYNRWKISNAFPSWSISPGTLQHLGAKSDELSLETVGIDQNSYAIRFIYHLSSNSNLMLLGGAIEIEMRDDHAQIKVKNKIETNQRIPIIGEFLLIKENARVIILIDGSLYIDQFVEITHPFQFIFRGEINISSVLIFTHSQIKFTYQNALNEDVQEISLISANTAIIKLQLYDELGRQRITTQPVEVKRSSNESVMTYDAEFVSNDNPINTDSVWLSGKLKGTITEWLGHPFGFSEIVYDNDPLNNKICIGLPGQQFSRKGHFARHFNTSSSNFFINNYWRKSNNYTHHVQFRSSNVQSISVFNEKNKKVANLITIPDGKNLLSTHEYNEKGLIIQSLPPIYYEKIDIFHKKDSNLFLINNENMHLKNLLETKFDYNDKGHLISKRSPDEAPIENIYNSNELLRFTIQYSKENQSEIESIIYFQYDDNDRLKSTGTLKEKLSKTELLKIVDKITIENADEFQYFYHNDLEKNPILRNKIFRSITIINDEPFIEELLLDYKGRIVNKKFIVPIKGEDPITYAIIKYYEGNFLKEITYPAAVNGEPFTVAYEYDKLGRMISVGVPDQIGCFMNATYNAYNRIVKETINPNSINQFIREYRYNEPGFLIEIDDPFLREDISYTEKAYGNQEYGDRTITRTKFTTKWHRKANNDLLGLHALHFESNVMSYSDFKICLDALKEAGYINENYQQTRMIYPNLATDLPFNCCNGRPGRQLALTLGSNAFPKIYGFHFDYGSNMELTKAKYFIGDYDQQPKPLQPDTFFKEIKSINISSSYLIWERLTNVEYILQDNAKMNMRWAHGKSGIKSFLNRAIFDDLRQVYGRNPIYKNMLQRLLINLFTQRQLTNLTLTEFQRSLGQMFGNSRPSDFDHITPKIYNILKDKGYLKNPIDDELTNSLIEFTEQLSDIVYVLQQYFAKQIGEAEFDVESYHIDANGNHKIFYAGFEHFEIDYNENTNQVKEVKIHDHAGIREKKSFRFLHDSRGNVIQALHKGIKSMEYHLVSNRLIRVKMTNGNLITFHYDNKGERVLKRVCNKNNEITLEIHYLRDDLGRTLVERKLTFIAPEQNPHVLITMYIYGSNSMIGFVRENQFYNVLTDHQGSVRIIIFKGEVVAAYDYMPYGQLMRIFGNNPGAHISYRYTAQEWDEEIGLYNYHARFYDPSIGRFYQVDPKSQYFSPYKYAGNSPMSMIDPTGEFAHLSFNIAVGLLGAYLDAAAMNGSWNPLKWNWKSADTYMALTLGFVSGFMLRPGFSASVKTFQALKIGVKTSKTLTTSVGLIFATTSAASEINIKSPKLYAGIFEGIATGVGVPGGIHALKSTWSQFGRKGKIILGTSTGFLAGYSVVIAGVATNWDFTNPKFMYGDMTGITSAADVPLMFVGIRNFVKKYWKKTIGSLQSAKKLASDGIERKQIKIMTRYMTKAGINIGGAVVTTGIGMFALTESSADWDLSEATSYYNFLSVTQFSGQLFSIAKTRIRYKKIPKIRERAKKVEKISEDIIDIAINKYDSILKDKKKQNKAALEESAMSLKTTTKNEEGRSPLSEIGKNKSPNEKNSNENRLDIPADVKIENTVIGVAATKKRIFVAFSSNKYPGVIIVFKHNKFSDPVLLDIEYLEKNYNIANQKIKIRDNIDEAEKIQAKIDSFQNHLKQKNKEQFQNEIRGKLENSMIKLGMDQNTLQSYMEKIDNELNEKGYISKKFLETASQNLPTLQNDNYQNQLAKIQDIEKEKIKHRKIKDKEKMFKQLKITDKNLKKEQALLTQMKINDRKKVVNTFYEELKPLEDRLTLWDPTNCAEIHCISAIERAHIIFSDKFPDKLDTSDILYLGAYNVKTNDPKKRCDHCAITTAEVQNVITDPDWKDKIEEQIKQIKDKTQIQKGRFFLKPIHNKYYELKMLKNNQTTRNGRGIDVRSRRSIEMDQKIIANNDLDNFNEDDGSAENKKFIKTPNILEFGDKFLKNININDTMFLFNVLFAKFTNRKLQGATEKNTLVEKNQFTIQMLELYEKSVETAANMSDIAMNRLNATDLISLEKIIHKNVVANEFNDLPKAMFNHAIQTLPSTSKGSPGRLSISKAQTFKNSFHELNLGKVISDMLVQRKGLNELSNTNLKMNVKPLTFNKKQALFSDSSRQFLPWRTKENFLN